MTSNFKSTRELRLCAAACRASGGPARKVATGRQLSRLRLGASRVFWQDGARIHSAPAR